MSGKNATFFTSTAQHCDIFCRLIIFTCVIIIRYKPLDADMKEMLSVDLFWLCCCSHFYSTEEEDEINYFGRPIVGYQSPTSTTPMSATTQWGGTEEAII